MPEEIRGENPDKWQFTGKIERESTGARFYFVVNTNDRHEMIDLLVSLYNEMEEKCKWNGITVAPIKVVKEKDKEVKE